MKIIVIENEDEFAKSIVLDWIRSIEKSTYQCIIDNVKAISISKKSEKVIKNIIKENEGKNITLDLTTIVVKKGNKNAS